MCSYQSFRSHIFEYFLSFTLFYLFQIIFSFFFFFSATKWRKIQWQSTDELVKFWWKIVIHLVNLMDPTIRWKSGEEPVTIQQKNRWQSDKEPVKFGQNLNDARDPWYIGIPENMIYSRLPNIVISSDFFHSFISRDYVSFAIVEFCD